MAEGIAAVIHLAVWPGLVAATTVAAPPLVAVYIVWNGDHPFWPKFWKRYVRCVSLAVGSLQRGSFAHERLATRCR